MAERRRLSSFDRRPRSWSSISVTSEELEVQDLYPLYPKGKITYQIAINVDFLAVAMELHVIERSHSFDELRACQLASAASCTVDSETTVPVTGQRCYAGRE